jgi:hypothetical protein
MPLLPRKSTLYLLFVAAGLSVLAGLFAHGARRVAASGPHLDEERRQVRLFQLTDLVLFTDARYTRHPSMADRHAPFQDYPQSLEHFPSGSLMLPPHHVRLHERR